MCGFGVSSVIGLNKVNKYCQRRGPDLTNNVVLNNIEFIHNLLNTQGKIVPQPYVRDDIAVIFNGDIYNHDGNELETILEAYHNYDTRYASYLDGEFAICIVDFPKNKVIISSDAFGTKPLWYYFDETRFAVTSYEGQIASLLNLSPNKISANTTLVFNMHGDKIDQHENVVFNLDQYKTSYDDWFLAFENSVMKRAQTNRKIFVGLSSGHDSGAIANQLKDIGVDFKCFSIGNNEDHDVLLDRYFEMGLDMEIMSVSKEEYKRYHRKLFKDFEDIEEYKFRVWASSVGLSLICDLATEEGHRVYLSGSGADEIISDYGFGGKKIMNHSQFRGVFPSDLNEVYPWKNFFGGLMEENLMRDEYVAGDNGVQTRYPFLDKVVVQEFLNLSPKLKNSKYKSVITEYLEQNGVPISDHKLGFMYGSTLTKSVLLWD